MFDLDFLLKVNELLIDRNEGTSVKNNYLRCRWV